MHFGPSCKRLAAFASFEFDLETVELRKNGVRLRLERKPGRALACLLERHGELVERGDLVALLWPGESHGDFDHRLNKAINKLRFILGDDSENPCFIRTHSGRGYCFVAEVRFFEPDPVGTTGPGAPGSASGPSTESEWLQGHRSFVADASGVPEQAPASVASETAHSLSAATRARMEIHRVRTATSVLQRLSFWASTYRTLLGAATILLGLCLLPAWLSHTRASQSQAPRSIALFGFTNLSENPGDAWLGEALTDWITTDLANGGQVHMVPTQAVARMRNELAMKGGDSLGPDLLAKLGRNLGSYLVISGSYAAVGSGDASTLRLDLQVQDTTSGEILHTISVTGRKSETFALASSAGAQLRGALKLGSLTAEGVETVRGTLPRNREAERFYTEGIAQLRRSDAVDARALLDQAIVIEPQHALSHSALSRAYSELGYNEKAREEAKKAFALAGGLPTTERLLVEGQFHEATFDWDKAINVYRSLQMLFPDNVEYALRLARAETSAGKAAMAFETLRQVRQFAVPATADAELDMAEAETAASISDFRHQQETAARAATTASQSDDSLLAARAEMIEGEAQRALGNFPEALRLWGNATQRFASFGDRNALAHILVDEGKLRWQQGDLPRAEQFYKQAIVSTKGLGDEAELGRALAGLGQIDMYRVSSEQGRKLCDEALVIFRRIGNQQEEAYVLSLVADTIAWRHAEAKPLYERSLELSRNINDRSRTAGRLMDLGIMATVQGDLATAEGDLQESLHIYHEIGERNREALQMSNLAIVYKWQGRLDEAEKLSKQAIDVLQSVGEVGVRGQVRQHLALIQLEAGKLTEAEQSLRLAAEEDRQAGDLGSLALAKANLAEILAAEGKVSESRTALEEFGKAAHWNLMPGEHVTAAVVTRARLYAADGQFGAALREAHRACSQALRMDQGSLHMKARLALGEIEIQSSKREAGRRELEQLARDAEARGFGLIHDQARGVLETQIPRLTAANTAVR